jgi:glutamine amidotransferase
MRKNPVTIIDYGMGNILSVYNALKFLGCDPVVSKDPTLIEKSQNLILPGVGSFRMAMKNLKDLRMDTAIIEAARESSKKILGICLGMQLLGTSSTEDGVTDGLKLIPSNVDTFTRDHLSEKKIPHVGFNEVQSLPESQLFQSLSSKSDFYFVHSYRMLPIQGVGISATCNYIDNFMAAYEKDNIFGTQFHPEKSQTNGLTLLENFLKI